MGFQDLWVKNEVLGGK